MRSVLVCVALVCLGSLEAAAAAPKRPGGTITLNAPGKIHSMAGQSDATYSGITITNGTISQLSANTISGGIDLPAGAAVYPGFIDSHSHAISLLAAQSIAPNGSPYWISLANVNVMQLPDCASPLPGSVTCFTPITTQAQAKTLIQNAQPNAAGWVLGWNYEPSRLTCANGTYGFLCTDNFENQNASTVRQVLDGLQPKTPVLITSESGHIFYVNTPALKLLNICNLPGATKGCYTPVVNPVVETKLASTGQLDEDLALHAYGTVEGILQKNAGSAFLAKQILTSLNLYSQLGYTTVQEGAANAVLIGVYMDLAGHMAASNTYLPATMAFLQYDGTTAGKLGPSVKAAGVLQKTMTNKGFDMFIAGMKVYADGSNQGYTGDMTSPVVYQNQFKQFTNPKIFPQPYDGLPDYDKAQVTTAAIVAHAGGFPLWVHTNGNQAQTNVVGALAGNQSANLRDVIVHFAMPSPTQVDTVAKSGIGATFLVNDFYYFYQPVCEQILGAAASANLYPAKWAEAAGVHYGLHSDASVTPASPLFGIWAASTRSVQNNFGLPPMSSACQATTQNQVISRWNAMQAYTSEAAWLYHRDTTTSAGPGIGSLQQGFAGDLVVLSADPLDPNTDLSTVYVLYTIHNGNIVYPASGNGPATSGPVWPD